MFPSFSLSFILGLEEETFYYWYRRALEIKYGRDISEAVNEDGKVDDDTFSEAGESVICKT